GRRPARSARSRAPSLCLDPIVAAGCRARDTRGGARGAAPGLHTSRRSGCARRYRARAPIRTTSLPGSPRGSRPCAARVARSDHSRPLPSQLGNVIALQALGLMPGDQGLQQLVQIAVDDAVELVQGETDAVIGHAILREIIGADLLRAFAG